jgi:single stranded DNA-binding protein
MAYNNTVILIGNLGSEARIIATEEYTFAAVSLATTDSYQDQEGHWQDKVTIWHNVVAFNPCVIEEMKSLKTGTRIKVTGSLTYRPFEVVDGNGQVITKKEASVVAGKVELAALPKKAKKQSETA